MNNNNYDPFEELKQKNQDQLDRMAKHNTSLTSKLQGNEKLYFQLWYFKKNIVLQLHIIFSTLLFTLLFTTGWSSEVVLAIFSIGVLSVTVEDLLLFIVTKNFRTKFYKSKNSEFTNINYTKGEVGFRVLLSTFITVLMLYFINDQYFSSNSKLDFHSLPVLLAGVYFFLLSAIRLYTIYSVTDQVLDLSITFTRRALQPAALVLLIFTLHFINIFSTAFGCFTFLLIYFIIRYYGLFFSSIFLRSEESLSKLENQIEEFAKNIRNK